MFIVAPRENYKLERRKDNTPRWKKVTQIAAVLIALGLLFVNIFQLRATQEAATAAKKSADLSEHTLEGTDTAVFRIDQITPNGGNYWRIHLGNFGKVAAPTLHVKYSVMHETFPGQQAIGKPENGSHDQAEVVPRVSGEDDVLIDFRAGTAERMSHLIAAEEVFNIKVSVTYDNGFGRTVSTQFCWETYPFGQTVDWQSCDAAEVILDRVAHKKL